MLNFKNRLDIGPTNWVMKSKKLDDPKSLFSKGSGWFRAYHVFALVIYWRILVRAEWVRVGWFRCTLYNV